MHVRRAEPLCAAHFFGAVLHDGGFADGDLPIACEGAHAIAPDGADRRSLDHTVSSSFGRANAASVASARSASFS